ncbi:hypothetical protein NC651_014672 [Populus alba x Populus x berolinensis]|nr:hypothetical protein NC651_014385 [Populus alba x Populus x berolinensis]KAJ6920793.1 hypothetical protein NC651_014389 [Populus alba x Populus x berolinensis]KAJ6921160.1 hypothetical protein NC651_014672 [Populus alba x Populus x berolinensis]
MCMRLTHNLQGLVRKRKPHSSLGMSQPFQEDNFGEQYKRTAGQYWVCSPIPVLDCQFCLSWTFSICISATQDN